MGEPVTEHEHECEAADAYSVLSSGGPKTLASGEEVTSLDNEAEEAELVPQTIKNADATPESEYQTVQDKSSQTSIDIDLSVQSKVDENELIGSDEPYMNNSDEPIKEVSCEGTVHGDQAAGNIAIELSIKSNLSVADHGFLAAHEHTMDDDREQRNKYAACQPTLKPFCDSSSHGDYNKVAEPVDSAERKAPVSSVGEDISAFSASIVNDIHDAKAAPDHIKSEASSVDKDVERHASRVIDTHFDISGATASETIGNSVTSTCCSITKPDNGFQISYRSSRQENSGLPPRCGVFTDKHQHIYSDFLNTLQLSPVPDLSISSNSEGPLGNSQATNVHVGIGEKNPHLLVENSVQHHLPGMLEDLVTNDELNISCQVAKHSASVGLEFSTCTVATGMLLDNCNLRAESGTVPHVSGGSAKSPKLCLSEDFSGSVVPPSVGGTSARSLNKTLVEHNLLEASKVDTNACVGPGPSEVISAGIITAHSVDPGSACRVSKMVVEFSS